MKSRVTGVVVSIAACAALGFGAAGRADTITFDDLPLTQQGGANLPSNYHGLSWGHWGYETSSTALSPNGYGPGTVSGPNVAFNSFGDMASISSVAFDLNSGYFTAAWNDNLQLTVTGFRNGLQVYVNTYTLSATAPTFIPLNYLQITSVSFNSFGGTPHGYLNGSGNNFALDNLTINGAVAPLPAAFTAGIPMLVVAAGGTWVGRRRVVRG